MAEQEFTTEELQNEIWKEVPGYEGWYAVSSLGRVRRDAPGKGTWSGRILCLGTDSDGYLTIGFSVHSRLKTQKVHQLVMLAFVGPRGKRIEVNHKDGHKANNRLENLEYLPTAKNMEHAHNLGLYPTGQEHHWSKLTEAQVVDILDRLSHGQRFSHVARFHGVTSQCVRRIYFGLNWKHVPRPPVVTPPKLNTPRKMKN